MSGLIIELLVSFHRQHTLNLVNSDVRNFDYEMMARKCSSRVFHSQSCTRWNMDKFARFLSNPCSWIFSFDFIYEVESKVSRFSRAEFTLTLFDDLEYLRASYFLKIISASLRCLQDWICFEEKLQFHVFWLLTLLTSACSRWLGWLSCWEFLRVS